MKIQYKLLLGASVIGASLFAGCGDSATTDPGDAGTDVTTTTDSSTVDSAKTDTGVDAAVATFTVGGTITGYTGTGLVLENAAESVTVPKSATTYTLSKQVPAGTAYDIKVKTQPSDPTQTCTVTNGKGTVTANINNINVNCVTNTYDVTATVVGLKGTGLVLQNNAADDLAVSVGDGGASTTATFATKVASGANYAVTIKTQPSTQTCTVMGGTGTVVAGPITTVTVTCVTNKYTVGGTVAGLAGSGLVLQNNAGDDATVNANGTYAFPTAPDDGSAYVVTVKTQPTNLSQTCTVANGTGTINGANVTNVDVTCVTNTYTVGGTVTGLSGTGLVLQNNGGNNRTITANGSFAFSTAVISGGTYSVTTLTNPTGPSQTCTVTNGGGTVTSSNITNVTVTCVTNGYTIGGTVSGLAAPGLVLRNNGGNDLTVNASGAFTFPTAVLSGATYAVTVQTQPANQTCTVTSGTGTVAAANVTNVAVNCASTYQSCLAIKLALPASVSGDYAIDPDGSGPLSSLRVYCDMTTDGGGYTMYSVTNGISTTRFDQANSCTAVGLKIAVPRTKAHLSALFAKYGGSFFTTIPGVYGLAAGNYTANQMNSSDVTMAANWKAISPGPWFARDATYSEPNGDYTPGCWLGSSQTLGNNGFTGFNDANCAYSTGTSYVCSDNIKGGEIGPVHTFEGLTSSHYITQGSCSLGQGNAADADYFCKRFYKSNACVAVSFTPNSVTGTTPKMHKRGGCTGNGLSIPGTTCEGGTCMIGNWNEGTSGLSIVCACP